MNANERDILLDVKNLHTHFISGHGKTKVTVKAVNGVSFQVKNGETFGLVGESGCGKTTLGRTIIRLYNPSSGEVTFGGRIISGKKDAELQKFLTSNIAMVFQDPIASLNPRMTVQEIIAEGLKIKGIKDEATVRNMVGEALYRVGLLPEHATRYPHEFSGGQRQRISIGRALASYPELIICDEPVSALDVAIQAQILNLFMDLQEKNNLTYLFISHDLGVVQHMCDDIGVMYLGRFAEVADKVSLFTSPAHPYTYSLLSVVPQVSRSPKGGRVKLLGDPPSPIDLKPGCRFNTRCPFAEDVCRHEEPELRKIGDNHFVACHLVRDGLGPHQRGGEWKV